MTWWLELLAKGGQGEGNPALGFLLMALVVMFVWSTLFSGCGN